VAGCGADLGLGAGDMTDDHWFLTYVVVWTVLSVGAGAVLGALIF
jgi:hypothetical protein